MHYQTRYDIWDSKWIVLRDEEIVEGLAFSEESQAQTVALALNDAVAFGEAKCKSAIRETADLFFNR